MKTQDLLDPEILHLYISHLPIAGLFLGLVALLISLFLRNNFARVMALCIIMIASLSVWPAALTGDRAYAKGTQGVDGVGSTWVEVHAERADRAKFYYYGLAAVAALSLLASPAQPGLLMLSTTFTFICTIVMIGTGIWVGNAGILANHRSVRSVDPPAPSLPPSRGRDGGDIPSNR